jgi:protein-S-isoprenylcysteine O-methyltransferase Ste14
MSDAPAGERRPTGTTLQIGGLRLTGASALVALLLIVAAIVAIVWLSHPILRWGWLWVSAALWIAFMVYWGGQAAKSSPIKSAESPGSRALHQNLLNLSLMLLFLRLPGLGWRWLPARVVFIAAGLALHVLSFALAVWARGHLGRQWSGAITVKVDHQLIRTGPYRLIRHPIYTAMLGMSLGTAIVSGELHALLGFAIMAFAYARKIPLEERSLGEAFGPAYEQYRAQSRALVPGIF